jgi:ABC-type ATPase with predicted acetyltransferase domain
MKLRLGPRTVKVLFKEIETDEELALFESLRKFHYRGGGGAGRAVPIIAVTDVWDLPTILGFVELSSSMIANTARKRFMQFPYKDPNGPSWRTWDHAAARKYSSIICRISRFVIHPEIRGLGLAKPFFAAAKEYAAKRWHYGGYRPRFLEITADMLKFYKFVDPSFAYMGETEGNEHRLSKDMMYLVKKALSEGDEMPQGGGGIMTLQRSYASQLMRYLNSYKKNLPDVVRSLQFEPGMLDQLTWESLYRLNRRPKPSYVSGLTPAAKSYVNLRRPSIQKALPERSSATRKNSSWQFKDVTLHVGSTIEQSTEARVLQDAFGFVGSAVSTEIIRDLSFTLPRRAITLVCGASGSGKSLIVRACSGLLRRDESQEMSFSEGITIEVKGTVNASAKVIDLPKIPMQKTALEVKGRIPLRRFLEITARCGLAEPQLFVRPISSLSAGQIYRLRVAFAFLANPDVIVIDNFCEPLDQYTAVAVMRGLRHLAIELDVAVLAATASYERLLGIKSIDQTLLLRRGGNPVVTGQRTTR